MHVLHVISSITRVDGGPTAALIGLCRAQVASGLQVSVLSGFREGETDSVSDVLLKSGVAVNLVGPTSGLFRSHSDMRRNLFDLAERVDILHIHALWEEIQHQAASVSRELQIPYIFRPCGMLDPWSLNQGKWKKRIYMAWRLRRDLNLAAAIHFTAEKERDLTAPLHLRAPSIVEPNGIDLSEFAELPQRGRFRARFPSLGNRPIVLFLSRLHPKKGLDLLIPAFAAGAPPEAMLVLAGPCDDRYRVELDRLVRKHDLGQRVIMPGLLRDVERLEAYVDAELFCLPSYQENFGIAVVEAMAAGLAVIISDKVNLDRDVIAAGAGAVVPTQIEPLADAMNQWLFDKSLRQRAGAAGREYAFQRFSWNAIAARWLKHYKALLEVRRSDDY